MKILLVRPAPSEETIGLQHLMIVEPLELEILAALKRPSDEVLVLDMILEKKPFDYFLKQFNPDILCVTGYITNVPAMIRYCSTGKNLNTALVTIAGGVHCEVCPDDLDHPNVDFRVVRNAAVTFTRLLNHIESNEELPPGILKKSESLLEPNLPAFDFRVPFPDRTSVARYRKKYFYIFQDKVALIKTSFGCPYSCTFCFCKVITSGKYIRRPLPEILDELQSISEKEIYIVDDDFLFDSRWLKEFIAGIKSRKIEKHFLVYGRADFIAENPALMHELKLIGLKTVIVGFESFSDTELDRYNKKTHAGMYRQTMEVLKREKIDCFATIIIPPHWSKNDFRHMVKTIKELGIHFVNLQPLTPLPGTGLSFDENEMMISRSEYEKWDLAHVAIKPSSLSVAEFYSELLKAYMSILYHPPVLLKYLVSYKPAMLLKMFFGGLRVNKQYRKKMKESRNA
jgi:radical SAM superfamily enzyme YgiQ (UPF0313 family)